VRGTLTGGLIGAVLWCGAMATASAGSRVGCGQCRCWARLTPKLDILRLTTRALERRRRWGSRWRAISRSPSVRAAARRSGGKGRLRGHLAAYEAEGAGEGEPVGVGVDVLRCGVHELADRVVDQEVAPDLLLDAVG